MSAYILYLEDDAGERHFTSEHISDRLQKIVGEQKYIVKDFSRIDQAKEFFRENMNNIICVITDLNMSDEWLEGYENKTEGGMLSGWVWLNEFVYAEKPDMPTIIYSGFISFLEESLKKNKELHLLHKKRNIKCVDKNGDYEILLKVLHELGVRKYTCYIIYRLIIIY
jgi:plasmid replication initiation protein